MNPAAGAFSRRTLNGFHNSFCRTTRGSGTRRRAGDHFRAVELQAPKREPGLGAVRLWAIAAAAGAPAGVEPIRWYLLRTLPAENVEQAVERPRWHALRFQIEVCHRTLKSGCQIEDDARVAPTTACLPSGGPGRCCSGCTPRLVI